MSMFARRMFMAQNVKRAVAGLEITFTVKEWFLDPDNSFTDTEVGALQYMTVKIGSETKQTDANGQVVFTLADGSYTYEVYDNARYLTTYRDDITVSGAAQSISVKCYACLYKPTDVWDMINNDSYVPVASGAELNSLRNTGSRTMGGNTIFVNNYTTGVAEKKYVVVQNCNAADIVYVIGDSGDVNFIFDGNKLVIYDYATDGLANTGLFRLRSPQVVKNVIAHGTITNGTSNAAILCYDHNGIIENCDVYGYAESSSRVGLVCGALNGGRIKNTNAYGSVKITGTARYGAGLIFAGPVGSLTGELIENCHAFGNVEGFDADSIGVFGGYFTRGTIKDSTATGTCKNPGTSGDKYFGGFVGAKDGAGTIIENCSAHVEVTGRRYGGGFCGFSRGANSFIRNCYATGDVTLTQEYAAGFIARNLTSGTILNSYSIGVVAGSANTGGFCAQNTAIITNSYYDSQTSGQSDTGKGLPRTTAQMQAGTANSYILPDGTTDPDSLPVNAMYLNWDGNIWEFGTTSEYPTLK